MKATEILQKDITFAYPEIHSSRLKTFFTFVKSGLRDQRVSVTNAEHPETMAVIMSEALLVTDLCPYKLNL